MTVLLRDIPSSNELDRRANELMAEAQRLPEGKKKTALILRAAGDRFKAELMRIAETHAP